MADFFDKTDNRENTEKEEVLSIPVKAGKRTYFFDVKETRANDCYITITESKKHFNDDDGRFYFEKHKLFLYKEDFEKFANALNDSVEFIKTGKRPDMSKYVGPAREEDTDANVADPSSNKHA